MIKLNEFWHVPCIDFISEKVKNSDEESSYEYVFRKFVKDYHPNKHTMIDIGANIGIYSRSCAMFFKEVYAFEPIKIIFDCLKKNTEQHKNINLYNCAIGHPTPDAKFLFNKNNCGNTKQIFDDSLVSELVFNSEVQSLDSFTFFDVNYIKIDVEGFEMEVLENSKTTIKEFMPWVQVEVNGSLNEIENFLKSIGNFKIIDLKNKHNKLFIPLTGKNLLK